MSAEADVTGVAVTTGADHSAAEFEQHRHEVYGWAYRLLGRHHDALDVAQDVFLRWLGHRGADAPQHPRAWLRRVTINRSSGTIVISGDTRMSPVIVSQKGMTVTVAAPLADGTFPVPAFEQRDFVPLDRRDNRQSNVRDLLEALNRLKTPFEDRVSILEEIHRAGKLHARLSYQG